jgi:hypothetical protein
MDIWNTEIKGNYFFLSNAFPVCVLYAIIYNDSALILSSEKNDLRAKQECVNGKPLVKMESGCEGVFLLEHLKISKIMHVHRK